jgi:hypothetical protein
LLTGNSGEKKNGKQGYLAGIITNQLTLSNYSIPENLIFACFTALGSSQRAKWFRGMLCDLMRVGRDEISYSSLVLYLKRQENM